MQVSSITLGIALRYVLDALRKPADPKMFNFGVRAIRQFKTELPGWPQYCQFVLEIPQVQEADPGLVQFIDAALREQGLRNDRPEEPEGAIGMRNTQLSDTNGVLASLGSEDLLGQLPDQPSTSHSPGWNQVA